MQSNSIIIGWVKWHFAEVPASLLKAWKNYLDFSSNYFSVDLLLKTFFSPWRRYRWEYPKNFDIFGFFSTAVSNFFSRILGAIMRIALVITGIVCEIFVVVAGLFVILLWYLVPLIIVSGFLFVFLI